MVSHLLQGVLVFGLLAEGFWQAGPSNQIAGRWQGLWCGLETATLQLDVVATGLSAELTSRPLKMQRNARTCAELNLMANGEATTSKLKDVAFDGQILRGSSDVMVNGKTVTTLLKWSYTGDRLILHGEQPVEPSVFKRISPAPLAPPSGLGQQPDEAAKRIRESGVDPPMGNADVLEMLTGGLSAETVALAITNRKRAQFDTSTTALIALKKRGVPDQVLNAMIARSAADTAAVSSSAPITDGSRAELPAYLKQLEQRLGGLQQFRTQKASELDSAQNTARLNRTNCNNSNWVGALNCIGADVGDRAVASRDAEIRRIDAEIQKVQDQLSALRTAIASDPSGASAKILASGFGLDATAAPPPPMGKVRTDPNSIDVAKGLFKPQRGVLRLSPESIEFRSDDRRDSFVAPLHLVVVDKLKDSTSLSWPGHKEFFNHDVENTENHGLKEIIEDAQMGNPITTAEARAAMRKGHEKSGRWQGVEGKLIESDSSRRTSDLSVVDGLSLYWFTPLTWIAQRASIEGKLTIADIGPDDRRPNIIRVAAYRSSPRKRGSAKTHPLSIHFKIRDSEVTDESQPIREFPVSRAGMEGVIAEFKIPALQAMGIKKSKFIVQVTSERGDQVEFMIERDALDPPSLKIQD